MVREGKGPSPLGRTQKQRTRKRVCSLIFIGLGDSLTVTLRDKQMKPRFQGWGNQKNGGGGGVVTTMGKLQKEGSFRRHYRGHSELEALFTYILGISGRQWVMARNVSEDRPQIAMYRQDHMQTASGKWQDPGTDKTVKLSVL